MWCSSRCVPLLQIYVSYKVGFNGQHACHWFIQLTLIPDAIYYAYNNVRPTQSSPFHPPAPLETGSKKTLRLIRDLYNESIFALCAW